MSEAKVEAKRPTEHDPKVVAIHTAAIRERVREYLLQSGAPHYPHDPDDMDTAMEDVERAMDLESDGYRIAGNLEDCGWNADAKLVEFMHGLVSERGDAHRQVVRDWVIAEGIKPAFAVGARVVFASRKKLDAAVEGEIIKIDEERAHYLVFIASEGHVRKGIGTLGTYVPFEDVRPSGTTAAASAEAPE